MWICDRTVERGGQLGNHCGVDGVEFLGSVEGDHRQGTVDLEGNGLVRHHGQHP